MSLSRKIVLFLAVLGLLGLGYFAFFGGDWTLPWQNTSMITVEGNTPSVLDDAEYVRHGDPEQQIEIVVGLKVRNEAELDALIAAQGDRSSPQFQKYISAEEFVERFSPTSANQDRVLIFLKSHGLTIVKTYPNRLIVVARGNIGQLEQAFGVTINEYSFEGETYISNDDDPRVPASLKDVVQSVIGLNTFAKFHSNMRPRQPSPKPNAPAAPSGMSPQKIATGYDFPNANNQNAGAKYSGAGVKIAIATAFIYNQSDIDEFWKRYGITRTGKVIDIHVGGTATQANGETTLDLQQTSSQAPGADILMYMGLDAKFTTFTQVFNQIVTDNNADVMSISWGLCEPWTGSAQMQTENAIFKQGFVQGMAIFAASGDDGAYDCRGAKQPVYAVDYPGSDPNVTAVGGTFLYLDGKNKRIFEQAWSGGGGGISWEWKKPAWQHGPGVPANDMRNTADVALVSDPWTGYATYFEGNWSVAGGTSFAAPNWAALWALGNEAAGHRVGSANALIYEMGRSAQYSSLFDDITKGDNGDGQGPGYSCGTAWDHPTGWGVPKGTNLVDWLGKNGTP